MFFMLSVYQHGVGKTRPFSSLFGRERAWQAAIGRRIFLYKKGDKKHRDFFIFVPKFFRQTTV